MATLAKIKTVPALEARTHLGEIMKEAQEGGPLELISLRELSIKNTRTRGSAAAGS